MPNELTMREALEMIEDIEECRSELLSDWEVDFFEYIRNEWVGPMLTEKMSDCVNRAYDKVMR